VARLTLAGATGTVINCPNRRLSVSRQNLEVRLTLDRTIARMDYFIVKLIKQRMPLGGKMRLANTVEFTKHPEKGMEGTAWRLCR
jgi:hypothetical protein